MVVRRCYPLTMFETIKGVIGDIATGAIKDQRIALSEEQLAALDLKLRDALAENTRLSQRVIELERLVADRDAELQKLRQHDQLYEESMGVLWKRTKDGFEQMPYCKDCPTHQIFTYIRQARLLVCGVAGHHAPPNVKPPDA